MKSHKTVIEGFRKACCLTDFECVIIRELRTKRPGIYTTLNHVSTSGMFRLISVYYIRNNEPFCLDHLVAKITWYRRDKKRKGLRVSGCGMDMGFALVYDLSTTIFPDGFKLKKGECGRNGKESGIDLDGGYGLSQSWM